jgi:hypothetical protein
VWRESFPGDARDKEKLYAMKREEEGQIDITAGSSLSRSSRIQTRRLTLTQRGSTWDDLWTETTSDDDE